MKLNLKLIASSFILALTLVAAQNSHASTDELFESTHELVVASSLTTIDVARQLGDEVTEPGDSMFQAGLPVEAMQLIFTHASNIGVNPDDLASVCLHWNYVMRGNALPNVKLNYSSMNNFMKNCMQLYWAAPLKSGTLSYTDPETKEVKRMKISDFEDPLNGTFDLSGCGDRHSKVRITTSVEEFFKVGGENEDRLVVLANTHDLIHGLHAEKFEGIKNWDPVVAPVGLFWRWGNWEDLSWYDYLTTSSIDDVASVDLYENWAKSRPTARLRAECVGGERRRWPDSHVFMFHF